MLPKDNYDITQAASKASKQMKGSFISQGIQNFFSKHIKAIQNDAAQSKSNLGQAVKQAVQAPKSKK